LHPFGVLDVVVNGVLLLFCLVTLLPVLHILAVSLSGADAFFAGEVGILPVDFTGLAYRILFRNGRLVRSFFNSILYTTVGTAVNMLLTTTLAYALSKRRLLFRSIYTNMVIITMFFSGGLIATFLLVRALGLVNSMWALVLPMAVSPFYLVIMRTFFRTIPDEIEESAFMDGANDIQVFWKLAIPLSTASLATVSLFYIVFHWNDWFQAFIYLNRVEQFPLQLMLRQLVIANQVEQEMMQASTMMDNIRSTSDESLKYATLFVSIVPMMLIYPFVQKYFVKGMMIGSLKG